MYEPLKKILADARSPGVSRGSALGYLRDAALEATTLRPTEDYTVKLALVISCAEDLVEARIIKSADLCNLADQMSDRRVKFGKSLDMRLAARLRRLALCP